MPVEPEPHESVLWPGAPAAIHVSSPNSSAALKDRPVEVGGIGFEAS
jgi:hypothetical protein